MKLVIFGLTISSSWGNGHATLWRGLCRGLAARGHEVVFFERDLPYYAAHRDLDQIPGGELVIFPEWQDIEAFAREQVRECDAVIVTSYCRDALRATELACESEALGIFYDLDTPVTLAQIAAGESVPYISPRGLRDFDLVLSYTGGPALEALKTTLHARVVAPLYGSVDPEQHRPVSPSAAYRSDLSYLGTFAADRQSALETLFVEPARRRPSGRFVIGGAQYPDAFPWAENIFFLQHLPPRDHPTFYCSSRLTLNVTRAAMAAYGFCPSGRLFEAAACGAPIISDWWEGLDQFFQPGKEILVAHTADDVLGAIDRDQSELQAIAASARERVLTSHTAARRAAELEEIIAARGEICEREAVEA